MTKPTLKRKYGDRSEWKRILQREYTQQFIDAETFKGYITLLHTVEVSEPLKKTYGENDVCIVDDGYMWLQQFPQDKHHSVTTMFNEQGEVVQWYIDICLQNGVENGVPWFDDLFLDIVVLPTGEIFVKDADELEEALSKGWIDQPLFELAWKEAKEIISLIETNRFELLELSKEHRNRLVESLVENSGL